MFYESVFRALDRGEVKYLVIGGIAVNIYGFYRATGDLDIMLSFDEHNLKKFIKTVKSLGFKPRIPVRIEEIGDPENLEKWKREKHMKVFSIYDPKKELEQIDILIEDYLDFDRAYESRKVVIARDISIPIISIDDLIELKKRAGRERDRIDIKALEKIKELADEGNQG